MAAVLIALFLAVAPGRLPAQEHQKATENAPAAPGPAAQPTPAGEYGAGEALPNPLEVQPTLSIWTLIVFLGLLALLGRFAWKPLLVALHQREHHLQHVLEETERARNESEGLLAEHRRQMTRAADEVRTILDKARQDAQATADHLIKLAQDEAEAARQRAQRDIAAARDQALAEIWQKAADTAVLVAGRVLSTELTPDDHRRLLDAAIRELPAAGANGHGGKRA
jgi:F-type H+-transporting ATPase subunit b